MGFAQIVLLTVLSVTLIHSYPSFRQVDQSGIAVNRRSTISLHSLQQALGIEEEVGDRKKRSPQIDSSEEDSNESNGNSSSEENGRKKRSPKGDSSSEESSESKSSEESDKSDESEESEESELSEEPEVTTEDPKRKKEITSK